GSPFCYWVTDSIRSLYRRLPPFEDGERCVQGGLKTGWDSRFIRLWWETTSADWRPIVKGGAHARYYADPYLLVDWSSNGDEISWYGFQKRPREGFGAASRGAAYYFRPGITWSLRTQRGLALRALPAGCIFLNKGPAAFVTSDQAAVLLALLG